MNKAFVLDQSEKVGLGAAVGGHLFLLALLVFGLFQAARPSGADGGGGGDGEGIAVSIVSETASAAPASGPVEPEPLPEVQEVAEVEPLANPEPVPVKKPVEKVAQKPSPVKKTIQPRKDAGKSSGRGSSDFDRRMKEVLQQQSSSGGSTSSSSSSSGGSTGGGGGSGGGGSSTAQEVKTARATISRQIRIGNCIPTGIDVNKVITKVTVKLASNGKLLSITDVSQSGQTASNRAQLEPIKRCIVDSVKKVDRFTGLDPATHSSWELISVPFASKG